MRYWDRATVECILFVYSVGSALVHGNNDFTADVVKVNGKKVAKAGRVYTPSDTAGFGRAVVAMSGGVDSGTNCALTVAALRVYRDIIAGAY